MNIVLFFIIFVVFSLAYYILNKKDIDNTKNYEFLIYALIGASAVIFVPIISKFFRK